MLNIDQFNKDYKEFGFERACENQGLDPLVSDKGHLIGSDGDTYGEHAIKTERGKKFFKGCWGDLAEWGKIKELNPFYGYVDY